MFFLPDPPAEARAAFNDYVRCHWPISVFALDPVTEDKNVADSLSVRREMQLAMSLAFTSGRIGARTMTRYIRRFEEDIETVALNRTVVGFAHGTDTFGWRFYPRVQTPPTPGNLEAVFRDLLVGGRDPDYYLRDRRLEPGQRECVALVVMPSFVPDMNLDVTANWFKLANPKHKQLTAKDTVRLKAAVDSVRRHLPGGNAHYAPGGDANHFLATKLRQLEDRLPFQHQLVNVPYENSQGGFELFASGVTDLAPELVGWYGGPGIVPDGETSLFLVGDNFSVHQTRVIISGVVLHSDAVDPSQPFVAPAVRPQVELLSRQVLRVTIPGGCQPKGGMIDVHVATPYGVSHHLAVPVVGAPPAAPRYGYSVSADGGKLKARYGLVPEGPPGRYRPVLLGPVEGGIKVD